MSSDTFDFGIDLGTTNSAAAILNGAAVEVVRDPMQDGRDYTPSVIYIRGADQPVIIGHAAKNRISSDPDNVATNFKAMMGTDVPHVFPTSRRSLLPEDLSAMILAHLKKNSEDRYGERPAVVVTCPAKFTTPAREATVRAAKLAGFSDVAILQEPIAAGLAYGFQQIRGRSSWLVYDMGGGTFDAAVLTCKDGAIDVVGHGGKEHMGGMTLDRKIVSDIVLPHMKLEVDELWDLGPDSEKWATIYAQLIDAAETVKVQLSRNDRATYELEFRQRLTGFEIDFALDIERSAIERLVEPDVDLSIEICRKVISDSGVSEGDINKLILVGGPTLMPIVRRRLQEEFDIEIATGVDPMTAVARGAAVFAGSQRVSRRAGTARAEGRASLTLAHIPIGHNPTPEISGRVDGVHALHSHGATVEFRLKGDTSWTSGAVPLQDGRFSTRLYARPDVRNEYQIILTNPQGRTISCEPEMITYTIGAVSSKQRTNAAIGIATADGAVDVLVEQGAELPLRRQAHHELAVDLYSDGDKDFSIPLVEGSDTDRADRNKIIGTISVSAAALPSYLAAGSRVMITITIDESGSMKADANVPGLGRVPCAMELELQVQESDVLGDAIESARERIQKLTDEAADSDDFDVAMKVSGFDPVPMLESIESAHEIASDDNEPLLLEVSERLNTLNSVLDEIEDVVGRADAIQEARGSFALLEQIVWEEGTPEEHVQFLSFEEKLASEIDDMSTLKVRTFAARIDELYYAVWCRMPESDRSWYRNLRARAHLSWDPTAAAELVQYGDLALRNSMQSDTDLAEHGLEQLKSICMALFRILPSGQLAIDDGSLRGVTRRSE